MSNLSITEQEAPRYKVSVEEYKNYHKLGFLKVESLLSAEHTEKLRNWTDDILHGRAKLDGEVHADGSLNGKHSADELIKKISRIHMLHRVNETAEWGLLHPRVLDVAEALIGPDVLALQSMLFYNPPGKGGQGWHQDSVYITTFPDTLIGAWIALERADEQNGCLWVVPGSNHEPIYPDVNITHGFVHAKEAFGDLTEVTGVSNLDDEANTLSRIVKRYPAPMPVVMNAGDVLFFHSHLFHRSFPNKTTERLRRSYVCHYSNARSWIPWNHGAAYEGDSANAEHILARGSTHLPYAKPKYGTPVTLREMKRGQETAMMGTESGEMLQVNVEDLPKDDH